MERAYIDALRMLGRRELSEAQVRQRLQRRAHTADDIEAAVARLRLERAIDDARVAGAIARWQVSVKHRGRARVVRAIEQAGISKETARRAADEAFTAVDGPSQIEGLVERRLRGRARADSQAELARLYRYLIGQGYDADEVHRALRVRAPRLQDD
jgi:regulatory protein